MTDGHDDTLSPEELRGWLELELARIERTAKLRSQNATEFVTACSKGELSPEQANREFMKYYSRWGETVLEGLGDPLGGSDSQVIRLLDERRAAETRGEEFFPGRSR